MATSEPLAVSSVNMERLVQARQLELLSPPTLASVFGLPIWAGVVYAVMSGTIPAVGTASTIAMSAWILQLLAVCVVVFLTDRQYRKARQNAGGFDVGKWAPRYTLILSLLSVSWASLCLFLWEPGNSLNNMTLTVFVICGVMNGLISRMNKFDTCLYGSGSAFFLLFVRHAMEPSALSMVFAGLLPLLFLTIAVNARAASNQIRKNISNQIENEILKEENAKARDTAERANKMKSTFLANMSHELRTPLNAVLGFSEIIASQAYGPSANEKYRDYAVDIHSSGKHLLDMINGLLDIAKIEAGKLELEMEWVNAHRALNDSCRLVEEKLNAKGVELRIDIDPEASSFWGDERSFKQIAINLLSNAAKFTSHGSVTVSVRRSGSAVILTVADTGVGIPEAQIARVFEAFEQGDNRYTKSNSGTGLGLTLVRALAKLHKGDCMIESVVDKGTKVSVTFPQPEHGNHSHSATVQHRVA